MLLDISYVTFPQIFYVAQMVVTAAWLRNDSISSIVQDMLHVCTLSHKLTETFC